MGPEVAAGRLRPIWGRGEVVLRGVVVVPGRQWRIEPVGDAMRAGAERPGPIHARMWIDQAMKRGRGRDFAFAMVNAR